MPLPAEVLPAAAGAPSLALACERFLVVGVSAWTSCSSCQRRCPTAATACTAGAAIAAVA